jgi:chemotaxis signal transduction protein
MDKFHLKTWEFLVQQGLVLTCISPEHVRLCCRVCTIFRCGSFYYGIPTQLVADIQPTNGYTPLPFTHPPIVGIGRIKGEQPMIVVLNLSTALDQFPLLVFPEDRQILVVALNSLRVGFLVDEVL